MNNFAVYKFQLGCFPQTVVGTQLEHYEEVIYCGHRVMKKGAKLLQNNGLLFSFTPAIITSFRLSDLVVSYWHLNESALDYSHS